MISGGGAADWLAYADADGEPPPPVEAGALLLPPPVEQALSSASVDAPRASVRAIRMGSVLLLAPLRAATDGQL